MNSPVCRWGILGAAEIARKNWKALRNAANCSLTAVASRDLEKARKFIADCQAHTPQASVPDACGSYDEVLARDDVDAVYIPLPTAVRGPWAIRAANAGKHVLIEKPAGTNADEVRAILAACAEHRVQFMDGVMFMHSARLPAIRNVLDGPEGIGELRRIASHFTFGAGEAFFQNDIRVDSRLEPLGCLGDLGWYDIRFILWAMHERLPTAVSGQVLSEYQSAHSPAPVPTDFSAELYYPGGVSANFYCSFHTDIQQWTHFGGTKGSLSVSDFVLPHYGAELGFEVSRPMFRINGCDFNMEEHVRRYGVHEYSNSAPNAQETAMFRHFAERVLSGRIDASWGHMALATQQVLDACLQSARHGGERTPLPPPPK